MAIESVNTLAAPTALRTDPTASESNDRLGKNAFMKLLTAQLKNQDPLNPTDSKEFVTQLSQLTSVEQLTNMDQRLQALEIATAGVGNTQAVGLMGKTVTADGSSLRLGQVGGVSADYNLTAPADVKIKILNSNGQVVSTVNVGTASTGPHTFQWDGTDGNGQRLPQGRYEMQVEAKDAAGNPAGAVSNYTGVVTNISYENGYPELMIGDRRIMLGDVMTVQQ